jgi:phosphatidylglycerophosphate synthase
LALLVASAALSATAAVLILFRHPSVAGLAVLGSGAALATVASAAATWPSLRVRFAELVLDRGFDAAVLLPVAWVERSGSNVDAVLALVGLGGSYLASYQRARGQALGYVGAEGWGYRVTRYAILSIGLLFGLIDLALWTYAVVVVAAAVVRTLNVVQQERRA